jgi:hypothetical protein
MYFQEILQTNPLGFIAFAGNTKDRSDSKGDPILAATDLTTMHIWLVPRPDLFA